jgi:hypothetical protein
METEHNNFLGSFPELMTEAEVIEYLRIPAVSKSEDYGNVIANLKRMRDLPCIHICRKPLYPREAIRKWIEEQLGKGQR